MSARSLLARAQLGAARATQQAAEALRRAATATDAREGAAAVLEAAGHGLGACARLAAYHAIAVVTGERADVAPTPPAGGVELRWPGIRVNVDRAAFAPGVEAEARRRIAEEARRDPKVARGLRLAGHRRAAPLRDDAVCKGDLGLGTACGRCSRCVATRTS